MKFVLAVFCLLSLSVANASGLGSLLQLVEIFTKSGADSGAAKVAPKVKYRNLDLKRFANPMSDRPIGLEIRGFSNPIMVKSPSNHLHIDLVTELPKLAKKTESLVDSLGKQAKNLGQSDPDILRITIRELAGHFMITHEGIRMTSKEAMDVDLLKAHKANAEKLFNILTSSGMASRHLDLSPQDFAKVRNILLTVCMDIDRL